MVFIFHTAKHLGSMFSQILSHDTYLFILTVVRVDRHHASLHHITHVFQEGGGLLRAPSLMELGAEVLALGSCLWDFQESPDFFFFLSLSARYGQAYSVHTACLLAKS